MYYKYTLICFAQKRSRDTKGHWSGWTRKILVTLTHKDTWQISHQLGEVFFFYQCPRNRMKRSNISFAYILGGPADITDIMPKPVTYARLTFLSHESYKKCSYNFAVYFGHIRITHHNLFLNKNHSHCIYKVYKPLSI